VQIDNAKGILWSITGGDDLTLHEVQDAAEIIQRSADEDAMIIFGTAMDPRMQAQVRVTVIATGFQARATGTTPFGRPVARPQRDIIGGIRPSPERRVEEQVPPPVRDTRPLPPVRDVSPAPTRTQSPIDRPPLEGDDLPPFLRQRR
jgi:cell division protein FtsZ